MNRLDSTFNPSDGDDSRMEMEEEEHEIVESIEGHTKRFESRQTLDPLDTWRIQTIQDGIILIAKQSTYKGGVAMTQLKAALFSVYNQELNLSEASKKFNIPQWYLCEYTQKLRHLLESGLPKKDSILSTGVHNTVTIDGITLPTSICLIQQWLTAGLLDYSKARSFEGTRHELREKLITILRPFSFFRNDIVNLVDGIMLVYVDGKPHVKACKMFKLTDKSISIYAKISKIFIDFASSKCTEDLYGDMPKLIPQVPTEKDVMEPPALLPKTRFLNNFSLPVLPNPLTHKRIPSSEAEPEPQLLPTPPERTIKESEIKDEIKEEPIEPPLDQPLSTDSLNADDRSIYSEWNGERYDPITMKLMKCNRITGWKFDENGENNAELLPIILLTNPSVGLETKERLKCAIQYVVNDRHSGLREKLYIRPLLIHHLCNGFSMDYLRSLYKMIILTKEQLQAYCTTITNIYAQTGSIISELKRNHSKCDKIIHVEKRKKEELKLAMGKKFPFLFSPQWIPPALERLTEEKMEWKKTACDFYMYYALIAITKLRALGYLLTDIFISEIVRVTVLNISSSVCSGEVWPSEYIKTVIEKNIKHI